MHDQFEQLDLDLEQSIPFSIVMSRPVERHGFAVLLRKGTKYASCVVRPAAGVIAAPNHVPGMDGYELCGPLSEPGFEAVLDWTDRLTTLDRYSRLVEMDMDAPADNPVRIFSRLQIQSIR